MEVCLRIFAVLFLTLLSSCANTDDHIIRAENPSCGTSAPAGFISIEGTRQESKIGGACWADGCRDPIGWPSAPVPLKAKTPAVIDIDLPAVSPMRHLEYMIKKVDESKRLRPDAKYLSALSVSDREQIMSFLDKNTLWNVDVTDVKVIAPLAKQRLTLDLESGLYLITMFGWWKGCGDATHGFLIQVDKEGK